MQNTCTCPEEGYSAACQWARAFGDGEPLGHVKQCPDHGGPCPCLPGSIAEAHCASAAYKRRDD